MYHERLESEGERVEREASEMSDLDQGGGVVVDSPGTQRAQQSAQVDADHLGTVT